MYSDALIEFDEEKRTSNVLKHGIDFTDVEPVFADPRAFATTTTMKAVKPMKHDFATAKRGAIVDSKGKTRITIFLDDDVLEHFREIAAANGRGYQTEINRHLRDSMQVTLEVPAAETIETQTIEVKLRRIDFDALDKTIGMLAKRFPKNKGLAVAQDAKAGASRKARARA